MPPKKNSGRGQRDIEELLQDPELIERVRKVWNDPTKVRPGAGDFDQLLGDAIRDAHDDRVQQEVSEFYQRASRAPTSRRGCLSAIATLSLLCVVALQGL